MVDLASVRKVPSCQKDPPWKQVFISIDSYCSMNLQKLELNVPPLHLHIKTGPLTPDAIGYYIVKFQNNQFYKFT